MSWSDETHEDDAVTRVLHSIQAGGQNLVMIARQRIAEVMDALDKGDFQEAYKAAEGIQTALGPICNAQSYMAVADGSRLMLARDLEAGMELVNVGKVEEIEFKECGHAACGGHVKVKIGEHESEYRGTTEFYVKVEYA